MHMTFIIDGLKNLLTKNLDLSSKRKFAKTVCIMLLAILFMAGCSDGYIQRTRYSDLVWQPPNYLWSVTNGYTFRLDLDTQEVRTYPLESITNLFVDQSGKIWAFGLDVHYFAHDEWLSTKLDRFVENMFEASDGTIWAITGEGYFRWNPETKSWIITTNSRGFSMSEFPNEVLWFGLKDSGIARLEVGSETISYVNDGLVDKGIYALTVSHDNTLWAGTRWGIHYFDGNGWVSEDIEGITDADGPVYGKFYETSDGTLWVSTTAGIAKRDASNHKWTGLNKEICDTNVSDFVEDNNKLLWVSCLYGIYRLDNNSLNIYDSKKGIEDNSFAHLAVDADGNLYAATYSGIYKYDLITDVWVVLDG